MKGYGPTKDYDYLGMAMAMAMGALLQYDGSQRSAGAAPSHTAYY
eukprot:COSAG02_NODE_41082_length_398_cov_1.016722_1_plen_44_part_10